MKTFILIFVAAFTLSFISHAQVKTGRINGMVKAPQDKSVESATVTLLQSKDSSVVKLGVSVRMAGTNSKIFRLENTLYP